MAVALRGAQDRNKGRLRAWKKDWASGGRPPGWPRIATWSRRAGPPQRSTVSVRRPAACASWRSPSGVAEDRNRSVTRWVCGGGGVAVAFHGGRGSQLLVHPGHRRLQHRGGRLPRRPRTATSASPGLGRRAARGGRLPQQPRIATRGSAPAPTPSRGVAVAFHGGRGSQHEVAGDVGGALGRRSPYRATEDGNIKQCRPDHVYEEWRSSSGVTEDRNGKAGYGKTEMGWRSPSRTAEDRNDEVVTRIRHHLVVVVVLRKTEDRNLRSRGAVAWSVRWQLSSGGPRIATVQGTGCREHPRCGGRFPGRPRIAGSRLRTVAAARSRGGRPMGLPRGRALSLIRCQ